MQWFQAVDQDKSNAIDALELQKALALGNLHFSLAVCAHIIRYGNRPALRADGIPASWYASHSVDAIACKFSHLRRIHDKDNTGTIDFQEFHTLHQFLTDTQNKYDNGFYPIMRGLGLLNIVTGVLAPALTAVCCQSQGITAVVRRKIHGCRFFKADKERRGKLIKDEVAGCLKEQGEPCDPCFH